jgi:hypothetical protein
MDERLPIEQQVFTCLEAQRYGGANTLNLSIFTGQLINTGQAVPDQTAIVGGDNVITPGTLALTVTVEQIVPIGWNWPDFTGVNAMPMLDRDWEYLNQSGLNNSQSNNIQLNRRQIQANTYFFQAGQDASLIETAVNNLSVSPIPQMVEKIGAQDQNRLDGATLQNEALQHFLAGATSWPAGIYAVDDWKSNAQFGYSLRNVQGVHSWDLNMGPTPGGAVQQISRMLHITYNASHSARAKAPGI